jgi:hypothetical protein
MYESHEGQLYPLLEPQKHSMFPGFIKLALGSLLPQSTATV